MRWIEDIIDGRCDWLWLGSQRLLLPRCRSGWLWGDLLRWHYMGIVNFVHCLIWAAIWLFRWESGSRYRGSWFFETGVVNRGAWRAWNIWTRPILPLLLEQTESRHEIWWRCELAVSGRDSSRRLQMKSTALWVLKSFRSKVKNLWAAEMSLGAVSARPTQCSSVAAQRSRAVFYRRPAVRFQSSFLPVLRLQGCFECLRLRMHRVLAYG